MSPNGVVLIIAGVWIVAQVTIGNALQRLGIVEGEEKPAPAPNVSPETGVPNTDPSKPIIRDPKGRPY